MFRNSYEGLSTNFFSWNSPQRREGRERGEGAKEKQRVGSDGKLIGSKLEM